MQNDKTECINEAVNTIKSHARRQAHNGRETKASERERRADIEMSISVCVWIENQKVKIRKMEMTPSSKCTESELETKSDRIMG